MVGQQEWEEVPIEGAITAGLPQASNPLQRCWNQFFREFVADVKGEGYMGLSTFTMATQRQQLSTLHGV
jgi:hypothetical protein